MRDGAGEDELRGIIRRVWTRRTDRYSEQRDALRREGRGLQKMEMHYIGG